MLRLAASFILLSGVAYAGDHTLSTPTYNQAVSNVAISSSATTRNSVRNNVSNKQGQAQGQEASANNSGVNIRGNDLVVAPSLGGFASGPCTGVGGQVSVGVAGFGGGAGFTALDESCTKRELARVLYMMGQAELAMKVLMLDPTVQAASGSSNQPNRTSADSSQNATTFCDRWPSDAYCKKN